jgi:hypothetical protein
MSSKERARKTEVLKTFIITSSSFEHNETLLAEWNTIVKKKGAVIQQNARYYGQIINLSIFDVNKKLIPIFEGK